MRIEDLNLTVRSCNILKRANINETEELVQYSREQILSIRCSSEETVQNIEAALQEQGLHLSPTLKPITTKPRACAADLVDGHKCFVERYPDPLQTTLKDRGFHFLADFTNATKTHIAAIPGVTPEIFQEIIETLARFDLAFAEVDKYKPDVTHCFAEHFPEPLQSSLKKEHLFNHEDFVNISKSRLAALPGMTPVHLEHILKALDYCDVKIQA